MMSESRRCIILLLNAVAGLLSVSGAGITSIYVCPGESVQAFQNIKFNRYNAVVTLSRNGDRNTEIAMWSYQNYTLNATFSSKYENRVFLDENGTITINNFHHFDQAKYVATSKMDPLPMIYEVQLHVMVAPTKECKPMIEKIGNSLIASLKADDCGKPVAIPYWKDHDSVSNTNEAMLKLSPRNEVATYYACIKGPAVACATNVTSRDYCSTFTIEGSNSPTTTPETCTTTTPEACNTNTPALIVVTTLLGIVFIWAIAVSLKYIQTIRGRKTFNGEQTEGLLKKLPPETQHFDKLRSLGDDEQQILEIHCEEIDPQLTTHQAANYKSTQSSEPEHDIEESRTEHEPGTDPEKIRELQELRNAAMCKICFGSKMNVCFMPCKHMATCAKCSIPLDVCPVCRATIMEKMNICFE